MLHVHHALRNATEERPTLAEFHFGTQARATQDPRHIPVTLAQLGGASEMPVGGGMNSKDIAPVISDPSLVRHVAVIPTRSVPSS